jgi:hypothetical protein
MFCFGQIAQPMLTQVDERRIFGQRFARDLSGDT